MTTRTALWLLSRLRSLDVTLWADGDQLRYEAPPGTLTPSLRAELIEHKPEILSFLRRADTAVEPNPPTITPRPHSGSLPLSFAQEQLWFLDQLTPGSPTYNVPTAVRLSGPLDPAALERSLHEIVHRHEALRTTFAAKNGRPLQRVRPASAFDFTLHRFDFTQSAEPDLQTQAFLQEQARQPFHLAQGPLIRASLLRLGEREHILLLVVHHIVFDGWSEELLFQELTALYQAFSTGQPSPLPEPAIQYGDFAIWQREWLQSDGLADQLAYWRQALEGSPTLLNLPTDRPRPPTQTFRGAHYALPLPQPLTGAMQALSRQEGVTRFMTLLAAFQVLLYRYTGQTDLLIGFPSANRSRPEIEGVIGFFVNTLVLRAEVAGRFTFRELLRRVRNLALDAYAHRDVPFEHVVEALQPARDLSYQPLFQVMFALQTSPLEKLQLPGITARRVPIDGGVSLFDLSLDMVEESDGSLTQLWEYNLDLFDSATIRRMTGHFQTLLAGIAADPGQSIAALPLLTPAEQRQLLVDWNDTATHYPQAEAIHHLFEAQVRQTPEAVAVTLAGQPLTYRVLNRRANQLAHYLQTQGVEPETLVGIYLERSVEMLVAVLGVLKAGGAYVPLDTASPQERLVAMLQDAAIPVLLTQQALAPALPASQVRLVFLDSHRPAIDQQRSDNPAVALTADNLAYTIFTSGSTGRSKGVMITHRNLVNAYRAWEEVYELRASTICHLQMANFSFDVFTGDWTRALCSGGKLVLCPREFLLAPNKLYDLMRREKVNCAEFVPAVIRNLVRYLAETGQSLDFMRILAVGSDNWYVAEYKEIEQFCGPKTRLINSYGLTEATIDSSYLETVPEHLTPDRPVPIGRPFANTQLYILDERLQPVPVGISGELYVGGLGLARGYLNRPALTAERFIPDPFSPERGARLYKTGDVARYLPDGAIELLGRIDTQVKLRGFRIELGEIETVLTQHPAVEAAVVTLAGGTAVHNGDGREEAKRLVAHIVSNTAQPPSTHQLRAFLKEKLPDYMIPAAVVPLDSLPLLPNGKINRQALPEPDPARLALDAPRIEPRDALEFDLARLWADLLQLDSIGVTENFFDLGGHSLLAVRLMAQIRQQFGRSLPLAALFQGATVEHLAEVLRKEPEFLEYTALVDIQPRGFRRPFFCVHPVGGSVICYAGLARHLGPDQPFYGLQARGLNGEAAPFEDFETMAAHYIIALRTVQPKGPYYLGGWSLGGVIAFEMARQLHQQDEPVALLALIDSWAPLADRQTAEDDAVLLVEFLEDLSGSRPGSSRTDGRPPLSPDPLRRFEPEEQLTYALEQARRLDLLPPDIGEIQFGHLFRVFKANIRAESNYIPQISSDRLTLFRAEAPAMLPSSTGPDRDPSLGWARLSTEPVAIRPVPGDHYSMLIEPQLHSLAEEIKAVLDQTMADHGRYPQNAIVNDDFKEG